MSFFKDLYNAASRLRKIVPVDDEFPLAMRNFTRACQAIDELPDVPKIVCLCGSTKFKDEFERYNKHFTLSGYIVLSVGCFMHHDKDALMEVDKARLDALHKRKIDLADEVFVINRGKYIGESTRSEIEYARATRKPIDYMELDNPEI